MSPCSTVGVSPLRKPIAVLKTPLWLVTCLSWFGRQKASSDVHAALKSISDRMIALNYGHHLRAAQKGRALAPDLNQCNDNPFDGCCYAFSKAFGAY